MSETTQLAIVDGKPLTKVPLKAGGVPRAIVPEDFDGAYRIANVVVTARMAPKTLDTVEKAMVAILHGLEVGLTPMAALQSIAVINNRPVIWGDGAIGLIRASNLLEYMQESFEGEGNKLTAVCIVKRKGEPKPVRSEFSWSDVLRAGLNKKEGPWQTYPRRMMQMRARAWPLRDVFADVLKGLSLREEVEDMERQDAPTSSAPDNPPPPEQKVRRVPPPPPPPAKAAPQVDERPSDGFPGDTPMEPSKQDPISSGVPLKDSEQKWLIDLRDAFEQCESLDELASTWQSDTLPAVESVSRAAFRQAEALYQSNRERFVNDG